jgi:hypothetical protein
VRIVITLVKVCATRPPFFLFSKGSLLETLQEWGSRAPEFFFLGISAVHIVLVVFLRFFLPNAGSVGHQCVRGWGLGEEEFSVRRNLLQRGISALVIVFLCTVRVYTCLCVSLERDT